MSNRPLLRSSINGDNEADPVKSAAAGGSDMLLSDQNARFARYGCFPSVYPVYGQGFLNWLAMQAVEPVLALYLTDRAWITSQDSGYFGWVTAVAQIAPVLMNPCLGWLTRQFGEKRAMLLAAIFSACGLLTILLTGNKYVFLFGYAFLYFAKAVNRTVHPAFIVKMTSSSVRLRVLAWVPMVATVGALAGPLVIMLCEFAPDPDHSSVWGILRVNSLTLCFAAALLAIIVNFICIVAFFNPVFPKTADGAGRVHSWHGDCTVSPGVVISTRRHVHKTLVHFATMAFLMNFTVGFYMVCLQPILVHKFQASQGFMARVAIAYSAVAILPPLIIALLAGRLSSRGIMCIGMLIKAIGVAVYAIPPGGLWQLILGYVLLLKGAVFILTAFVTLFSQLLAHRTTPMLIGVLMGVYASGLAVGAVVGSHVYSDFFGHDTFLLFGLGLVGAATLLLAPPFYRRLDLANPQLHLAIINARDPPAAPA